MKTLLGCMHGISSTSADTIVHIIKDVMLRLNLTFTSCGVSVMMELLVWLDINKE